MSNTDDGQSVGEFLKRWWFLLVAFFSVSVAYGSNLNKIQTLEDAVKANSRTQSDVADLRAGQRVLENSQRSMEKTQERHEEILRQLLMNSNQIVKQNRAISKTLNTK